MLSLSLLNPEEKPEEEKVESVTTSFSENIRSIYSQVISFFYTPESSEVIKLQGFLTLNRRLQNWYARQIILLETQLPILKEYLKDLDEGDVFNLLHINMMKRRIEMYLDTVNDLTTKLETYTEERIATINRLLRGDEEFFQERNINPAENSLRYLREKFADHLSLTTSTENKYNSRDIQIILDYIFCADMYERKYLRHSQSDETILAGLEGLKEELKSRNFSTSPYELKFQTTGIHRQLKEKIQTKILENTNELADCRMQYEFYALKVRNTVDEIDDLKFTEEQETANLSDAAQPEGYQALTGSV